MTGDVRVAHVTFPADSSHLKLQLKLHDDHKTFFRPITEKLDRVRYRLQLLASSNAPNASISKPKKHKKHKNGGFKGSVPTVNVRFIDAEDLEIPAKGSTIGDALMRTRSIEIGTETFVVLHNQPLVTGLSVLEPVLAGISMTPFLETEFCSADECTWRWFRLLPGQEGDKTQDLVCTTRRYTPSEQELGCRFYIECCAPNMQTEFAEQSKAQVTTTPVLPGPNRDVFAARRRMGSMSAAEKYPDNVDAFRVMSYNVLFGGYTTTNHAQKNLFPYADADIMKETYRMQLVLHEIEENNCDLVCLQEMGEQMYNSFFVPMMASLGYHGFYSGKTGTTQEGCATFVRTLTFEVIEEKTVNLGLAIKESSNPTVQNLLVEFPELTKGISRIPSIGQMTLLRSRQDPHRSLFLSNTHLFYREDAHLIRLLQAFALAENVSRWRSEPGLEDAAVVLCGDWNSHPETAPIAFLLDGQLDSSHRHWQEAPSFRWDLSRPDSSSRRGNEPTVCPGLLSHGLQLTSACGIPSFTNFAGTFVGTLDYILVGTKALEVRDVFPFFTEEEVSEQVALPSAKFPSDHVSLVCDLSW